MTPKKNSVLTEDAVRTIIKEEISNLPTIQEVENAMSYLPTKEHFDQRMDTLSKEIQDMRDEFTIHQGKHDEIEERLDTVEQKVGIQPL